MTDMDAPAPPGADAMQRAWAVLGYNQSLPADGYPEEAREAGNIARALQQYGDERAREARAAAIEEAAQKHDGWAAKASARAAASYGRGNKLAQGFELTEARVHEASAADFRALAAKPGSET